MKKKPREKIDPFDLFSQAYFAMDGDRILRSQHQVSNPLQQRSLSISSMILSAFSCELYLKCFISLDNRAPPTTHRLDIIFRQIAHKHKRIIERKWDESADGKKFAEGYARFMRQTSGRIMPTDLPNSLVTCADAFDRIRYRHERIDPFYYLSGLPFILCAILLELNPGWKEIDLNTPPKAHTR